MGRNDWAIHECTYMCTIIFGSIQIQKTTLIKTTIYTIIDITETRLKHTHKHVHSKIAIKNSQQH